MKTISSALFLVAILSCSPAFTAESLDRGVVALANPKGDIYIGWRLLASDPKEVAFDIVCSENASGPWKKINPKPIQDGCNYLDTTAGGKSFYYYVQPSTGPKLSEWAPVKADAMTPNAARTITVYKK